MAQVMVQIYGMFHDKILSRLISVSPGNRLSFFVVQFVGHVKSLPYMHTHDHRLFGCHTDDKEADHQNQEWMYNSNGTITSVMSGKCMEAEVSLGNHLRLKSMPFGVCSLKKVYIIPLSSFQ